MIVIIYSIIAMAFSMTIFKKYEGEIKDEDVWVESWKFWFAISMLVFPISVPAYFLSKVLSKFL